MFNCIEMGWSSALGEDRNAIREVILKFYYLPDFLTNSNMFVLGEWWSEYKYLTDQLPSTAVLLNTRAIEISYIPGQIVSHLCIHNFDTQLGKEKPWYMRLIIT